MLQNFINLMAKQRFLPLFITQFLGAFNDNVFKNALVILITYLIADQAGMDPQLLVTAAAGIFILPYFLLSATAGQMADKYEKGMLTRRLKLVELTLMVIAAGAFISQSIWALMVVLFMMGVQSTFFGPIKYSILPQHLEDNELLAGNALVSAGTFIAILLGTIAGGLLILAQFDFPLHEALGVNGGIVLVSAMCITVALAGVLASRFIPDAPPPEPKLRLNWHIPRETWRIIQFAREKEDVFLSLIGISWFWLVGATFLAQFPNFAKVILAADETVVTFFLTLFSVGIAIGSILCNRLLRGVISASYAPFGALGMAAAIFVLFLLTKDYPVAEGAELVDFAAFIALPYNWAIIGALLAVSVFGGVYVVPLYAVMQAFSAPEHRARIIAANNVMNALFMVASALISGALLAAGFRVTSVFLLLALANLPVAYVVRGIVMVQREKLRERIAIAREAERIGK